MMAACVEAIALMDHSGTGLALPNLISNGSRLALTERPMVLAALWLHLAGGRAWLLGRDSLQAHSPVARMCLGKIALEAHSLVMPYVPHVAGVCTWNG